MASIVARESEAAGIKAAAERIGVTAEVARTTTSKKAKLLRYRRLDAYLVLHLVWGVYVPYGVYWWCKHGIPIPHKEGGVMRKMCEEEKE